MTVQLKLLILHVIPAKTGIQQYSAGLFEMLRKEQLPPRDSEKIRFRSTESFSLTVGMMMEFLFVATPSGKMLFLILAIMDITQNFSIKTRYFYQKNAYRSRKTLRSKILAMDMDWKRLDRLYLGRV